MIKYAFWSILHVVRIMLVFFDYMLLYLFPINIYCQLYAMNAFFLADTGPINPIPFTFPLRTIISTASHNMHIHSSNCGPWQSVVLYSMWNHFRCFIQQFRGVGISCTWDQDQTKRPLQISPIGIRMAGPSIERTWTEGICLTNSWHRDWKHVMFVDGVVRPLGHVPNSNRTVC